MWRGWEEHRRAAENAPGSGRALHVVVGSHLVSPRSQRSPPSSYRLTVMPQGGIALGSQF